MSEKRLLRDRAVLLQKSTNLLSAKNVLFKSKSNGKENCLMHKKLKENNDSISDKMTVEFQKPKNQFYRRPERKTAKQNSTTKVKACTMKESKCFNKTKNSTSTNDQKQNVSGKNSIRLKEFTKNTECTKNAVLSNVENAHSEKILNTKKRENEITSNLKKIPIWKRNMNVSKPSKKLHSFDVYDITLDEEIAASKVQEKKARIQTTKNKLKENKKKRMHLSRPTKNLKTEKKKLSHSKPVVEKQVSKPDQISTIKLRPIEADKMITSETLLLDQNKYNNDVYVEQHDEQNSFFLSSPNDTIETIPCVFIDSQPSEPKDQSKIYLSNLVDELEKSFSVPKMTSTPDGNYSKTGIQVVKEKVINVANISTIPANSKNCLNSTVATPVPSDNNVLPETDKNIKEILLFESPEKPEAKEQNDKVSSPQKTIQINLFGDVLRTPSSAGSSEDSSLMSKKAYHTPDNFKVHLIQTKRPVAKIRKEPKKSKQDLLIEKMSQHFDEIEDTELYIE